MEILRFGLRYVVERIVRFFFPFAGQTRPATWLVLFIRRRATLRNARHPARNFFLFLSPVRLDCGCDRVRACQPYLELRIAGGCGASYVDFVCISAYIMHYYPLSRAHLKSCDLDLSGSVPRKSLAAGFGSRLCIADKVPLLGLCSSEASDVDDDS